MPEVSVRTFLPVALATGTATFIARLYFGLEPAFQMPVLETYVATEPSSLFSRVWSLTIRAPNPLTAGLEALRCAS